MQRIPYRVELDLVSGPLDLLLYLVRRNELDVRHLLVSQVVEQFLEYLEILKAIDLDIVGDFIVMAGALAEYKSRLVLPQQTENSEPDLDDETGIDLIPQIIEYRKFRKQHGCSRTRLRSGKNDLRASLRTGHLPGVTCRRTR